MSDLATWLRARLDDDEAEWQPTAGGPRQNGKTLARRMLREVDVKRRLLELHPAAGLLSAPDSCGSCAAHPGPCDTLRLLALPYADRPGYQPEWQPDPTSLT